MSAKNRVIIGLDVGSFTIKCCAGSIDKYGSKEIVHMVSVPSRGIEAGVVYDLPSLISSIESVLHTLERETNLVGNYFFIGLNGEHVNREDHNVKIEINNNDGQILKKDLSKIKSLVKNVSLPFDRQLIHVIPVDYEIDGIRGINNPLGMYGSRLGLNVNIVSVYRNYIQNYVQVIKGCGVEIEEFRLSLLATSEVVLQEEAKQEGVLLIDIGSHLTEIGLFKNGHLFDYFVVKVGGDSITKAVADGFSISYSVAESLKKRYGSCISTSRATDENLVVRTEYGQQYFSRQKLCRVIDEQAHKIISFIHEGIVSRKYYRNAEAGVTFIGGLCLLEGFMELAEQKMGISCKMGRFNHHVRTQLGIESMEQEFIPSFGLVKYGFDRFEFTRKSVRGKYLQKVVQATKDFYSDYF